MAGSDKRGPRKQTPRDRIVWGADYPENVVAIMNILMGLLILNPFVMTLPLAIFGRFLLALIPQEGVWGAFFLALGVLHYVIRARRYNRRLRRVMCAIAMTMWIIIWGITVVTDWRGTGTIILLVMVVNSWVAYQRLTDREIEGLWYAQRRT